METYVKKLFYFYIVSIFFGFTRFYLIRWFYPCRSFKQSEWWRHKL